MTYTEQEVQYLIASFTYTLVENDIIKPSDSVKIGRLIKSFWKENKDLDSLSDDDKVMVELFRKAL